MEREAALAVEREAERVVAPAEEPVVEREAAPAAAMAAEAARAPAVEPAAAREEAAATAVEQAPARAHASLHAMRSIRARQPINLRIKAASADRARASASNERASWKHL